MQAIIPKPIHIGVAFAALVIVALSAAPVHAQEEPTLSLEPVSGPNLTTTVASGSGFSGSGDVEFTIGGEAAGTVTPGPDGSFAFELIIEGPLGDIPIQACQADADGAPCAVSASATFTLELPPSSTTTTTTSTTTTTTTTTPPTTTAPPSTTAVPATESPATTQAPQTTTEAPVAVAPVTEGDDNNESGSRGLLPAILATLLLGGLAVFAYIKFPAAKGLKDRVDADEPSGPPADLTHQPAEGQSADESDKGALTELQPARSELSYQESDGTELDDIGTPAHAEKGGIIDDEDGKGLAEDALKSMLPGPYDELPPPPNPSAPDPGTPLPNVDD